MTTLEIVFLGLISLSPTSDGQVLAMLSQEMVPTDGAHQPLVVQLVGSCEPDTDGGCSFTSPGAGEALECPDGKLCWQPSDLELTWDHDCTDGCGGELQESLDGLEAAGVLSVETIVPGWARLRPSCRKECSSCKARSRVRLPAGRLEPCHYIHHVEEAHWRAVYEVSGRRGSVANVVSLTVGVEDGAVRWTATPYSGGEPEAAATLRPEGGKIVLFVVNEPVLDTDSDKEMKVPERLGHFQAFYRLLHPFWNLPGVLSKRVPEFTGFYAPGEPGECEKYLETDSDEGAELGLWLQRRLIVAAPHSPAECDVATVP